MSRTEYEQQFAAPNVGDRVTFHGLTFTVTEREERPADDEVPGELACWDLRFAHQGACGTLVTWADACSVRTVQP